MNASMQKHMQFAKRLTTVLDTKFQILGIRFGIDPLLDLLPGFGNILGALIACYLFWIAYQLKVPSRVYIKMAVRIFLDYFFGLIPYIGVIVDLFYRANTKNLELLSPFIEGEVLEGEVVD